MPSPSSRPRKVARRLAGGCGDRVARDAFRQRHGHAEVAAAREAIALVPVLVDQVAEPQIGDARAADLAEASEWRGVRARAEQHVHPVAAALERRAVMRRAEEDELVETPQPRVARQRAVVAGAAGDEPAHAVPDEHELGQRHRPALHQRFEQLGERAPVGRDVEAAVVVQIDRRVPEVARQRGAVIVSLALPLQIVHAQAVHQHDQLAAGVRDRRGQRLAFARQRVTVPTQVHGDRQRVVRRRQVVAEHAVQRGEQRLAPRPACCARRATASSRASSLSSPCPTRPITPRMLR